MSNVVILGAGLSGLGCARHLPSARIFEAAPHVGGHVYSHEYRGVHFDEGAHICHAKDKEWLHLLYRQAGEVVQISQSRVSNYWRGHWVTYPVQNHLNELPADAKAQALKDFVAAQQEYMNRIPANYEEWCLFQYGRFLTDNFYREYTDKYWRVPMRELATDWLAGRLIPAQVQRVIAGAAAHQEEDQSVFARFHYPARGGFFGFFRKLYDGLDVAQNARAVGVDHRRKEITFSDGRTATYTSLASSIPLPDLVRIIVDAPSEVVQAGKQLRYTQLLCVNILLRRPAFIPHHWFYIYDPDVAVARVSVLNHLAPASVPEGLTAIQAEIFRRGDEPMDVDALSARAVQDLGRLLKFDPAREVEGVHPVHVPHAYVISDLERERAVATITAWLQTRDIFPMGLFGSWKFIWSDAAYASGRATAELIRARG